MLKRRDSRFRNASTSTGNALANSSIGGALSHAARDNASLPALPTASIWKIGICCNKSANSGAPMQP